MYKRAFCTVASLAEAWIEIVHADDYRQLYQSLPSRKRGLKCFSIRKAAFLTLVASLAEAWIEIGWLHRQVRR